PFFAAARTFDLTLPCYTLHRGLQSVPANVQHDRHQTAVRALRRDRPDLGTRYQFGLVARHHAHDDRVGADDHLLLTATLVLEDKLLAVGAGDLGVDRRVGHHRARAIVPGAVSLGGATAGFRENMDADRLERAVGLRHRRDTDVVVHFHVGDADLDEPTDADVVGELERRALARKRLHGEHI